MKQINFFWPIWYIFGQNDRKRGKIAAIDSLKTNNGIVLKFSQNLPIISYSPNQNIFPTTDGFSIARFFAFWPKIYSKMPHVWSNISRTNRNLEKIVVQWMHLITMHNSTKFYLNVIISEFIYCSMCKNVILKKTRTNIFFAFFITQP